MGLLVFKISVGLKRSVVGSTPIHSRLVFKETKLKHPKPFLFIVVLIITLISAGCKGSVPVVPTSESTNVVELTQAVTKGTLSNPTDTPEPSATAAPDPMPTKHWKIEGDQLRGVSLRVKHPWFGQSALAFSALVDAFNGSNEWGIKVEAISGKGLVELGEQLSAGKVDAELIIAQTYDILSYVKEQGFEDLKPYIHNSRFGLTDLFKDESPFADFSPVKDQSDQIWTLPLAYQPALLFYNQTWAETLGFSAFPLSRDAFTEQMMAGLNANLADADLNNNGTGGLLVTKTTRSAQGWYASFGGAFFPGDEYLNYYSETLLGTYQWLKRSFEQDSHWVGMESTPYDYFNRRLALAYEADLDNLAHQTAAMSSQDFGDRWLSMPYPTEDGRGMVALESLSIAIKTGDENSRDAAWLFARYLLQEAQQRALVDVHGYWPAIDAPAKVAPAYAEEHPAWASAVLPGVHFSLAPEGEKWAINRHIFKDAYLRVYGLDAQHFPNILDLLTQTLTNVQGAGND